MPNFPTTVTFSNLVHASSAVVGKPEQVVVERPEAFASPNAPGEMRPVESYDAVRELGTTAAARLKDMDI
ncbi:MAG TPA: hypothetical protein VK745_16675 [Polyangiaceae bacterium]|nr:hypothetical protein [Polyangiaceae bacterium]